MAAPAWELQVVASGIQDDPHNRTRFLAIGYIEPLVSGQDKTSLILAVPNRAGAVYEMLAPLAANGVSMTRFESRPPAPASGNTISTSMSWGTATTKTSPVPSPPCRRRSPI